MPTNLATHIHDTPILNTHEHMAKEADWLQLANGDVLVDLFSNYVPADFFAAGVNMEAWKRLMDPANPDLEQRFKDVETAWQNIQFTGYGEAVRLIAKLVYGLEEITARSLAAANGKYKSLVQPGQRLHLLRDVAKMDHIQTDDFCWPCLPDESGPDFFLYDLSWVGFANGLIDVKAIVDETGVTVSNLATLREAMSAIFAKYAACAIAVKSQHAYNRTLRWEERSDADAERALQAILKNPKTDDVATKLCLGDWCLARGVEHAIAHNLPFKIHTGYYAGNNYMPVDRIKPGNLCPLFIKYPGARFVLMHISYPYQEELIAIVKHFSNCWADLCWAWSINPLSSADFVRRFLHAAPANKLFAFGGDTFRPTSSVAYAAQMRRHLTRALQAEIDAGDMTEKQAIATATKLMQTNQRTCFDLEGTRAAIREAMAGQPA